MRIGINAIAPIPGHIGGSEVYVINLVDKIGQFDTENEYYIFVSKNNAELYNLSYKNYKKIVCNINSSSVYKRIFYEHTSLPGLIKKHNLDLFHAPQTAVPFRTPKNTVVTIHETIRFLYPDFIPRLLRYYYGINQYIAKSRVKKIIAVSKNDASEMSRFLKLPEDKIVPIYNGVSDKFINYLDDTAANKDKKSQKLTPSAKESTGTLHTDLELPDKYLLWVGRPYPHKNIPVIIKAFEILKKKFKVPHVLVLVGLGGLETDNILRQISSLNLEDEVKIFNFVENNTLPEIYKNAELLIFPSLYESFGIPVIEAMAVGTPVIASNITSLPEVVKDAGILVDPYKAGEVASAAYRVISDDAVRKKLVISGHKRAKEFTWDRTAKETLKLYKLCVQ